MKFKITNLNCEKCLARINKVLSKEFGEIKANLDTKILEVKLQQNQVENFCEKLNELGFEIEK